MNSFLFGETMSNEYTQMLCTYSEIKEGRLADVKQWLKSLENERRNEILENFQNEGVLLECAFVREEKGSFYLLYLMRAHDIDKAMEAFQNSTLPVDAFHKQCWQQFTEKHEILTPIFHVESAPQAAIDLNVCDLHEQKTIGIIQAYENQSMKKIQIHQAEKKVVGIKTRTNNRLEADSLEGKIFPIVKHYFHQNIAARIPNRVHPGITFCIYAQYESDHLGEYTYYIGEEVASFEGVPDDLETLVIPPQKYIKFTNGPDSMPDVVRKPWQQIWQMTPPELGGIRSYIADFEIYDERSRDHQNIVLDIYIGIQ